MILLKSLNKITSELKNKDLKLILTKEGYNSSGNESIASYIIKLLKKKFPIKFVKVWETEARYAIVYSDEI